MNEKIFDEIAATLNRDGDASAPMTKAGADVLAALLNALKVEPFQFPNDYESDENVQRYTAIYPYSGEGWGVEYIATERRWSASNDQRKCYGMYPDRDDCPEHGLQPVKHHGSTAGPDPYATATLACGHTVAALGMEDENVILDKPYYSKLAQMVRDGQIP